MGEFAGEAVTGLDGTVNQNRRLNAIKCSLYVFDAHVLLRQLDEHLRMAHQGKGQVANTDVGFDAFMLEVINGPYRQIVFDESKCILNHPQPPVARQEDVGGRLPIMGNDGVHTIPGRIGYHFFGVNFKHAAAICLGGVFHVSAVADQLFGISCLGFGGWRCVSLGNIRPGWGVWFLQIWPAWLVAAFSAICPKWTVCRQHPCMPAWRCRWR